MADALLLLGGLLAFAAVLLVVGDIVWEWLLSSLANETKEKYYYEQYPTIHDRSH